MNIEFDHKSWPTPNTYNENFRSLPDRPGVYVINHYDLDAHTNEILYIGSAKNIALRLRSHEVLRVISHFYYYTPISFMECTNYREVEKYLIKKYKPKFNKQYNA